MIQPCTSAVQFEDRVGVRGWWGGVASYFTPVHALTTWDSAVGLRHAGHVHDFILLKITKVAAQPLNFCDVEDEHKKACCVENQYLHQLQRIGIVGILNQDVNGQFSASSRGIKQAEHQIVDIKLVDVKLATSKR